MNKPEKKNSSFLVSEQYQEFECDALVVHSGNKISEGKIIQAVNGAITDGKHASTFIDYGATIGKSYRALGTLHPKKQAGTFGLITHDVIPATIQESLRRDLPNQQTDYQVRLRFRHSKKPVITEEEYVVSQQFQKNQVILDSVILSHAHPDHDGILPLLRDDIRVITSPATHLMQELEQEDNPSGWGNEKVKYREFSPTTQRKEKKERDYNDLTQGEIYNFAGQTGFYTNLIFTDHCIGSSAIEIQFTGGRRMLCLGDIRNGPKTEVLKDYLDSSSSQEIDLMQIDGTHIGKDVANYLTEDQLREAFTNRFSRNGPFYIGVNERDISRLTTIMQAAADRQKQVYISLQLAYYIKSLRDNLGESHPDVPDLSQLTVHLQPEETGRYMVSDYKYLYRPVIQDDSIKKIQQEDLQHTKQEAKNAVILFTHPHEMYLFGSRSLFKRGSRFMMSTTGYSPNDPFSYSRWNTVNNVVNANNMSLEKMNAIHHMNVEEFSNFIRNHSNARNILVFPNRDFQFTKDLIESNSRSKVNVISEITYGVPFSLDGQPLPRKAVSYPGRSA